jgi:hypothetical protein
MEIIDGTIASWIALGFFLLINIGGWCYTLGKLHGQVKNLKGDVDRHEKQLNEDGLSQQFANLDGSVRTYIAITKRHLGIPDDEQI